ncbi:hypothetical protein ID866_10898 [Astraeus odoratus]|nr:hypothetical protein ID866_10898 [Astraeus odoratus]
MFTSTTLLVFILLALSIGNSESSPAHRGIAKTLLGRVSDSTCPKPLYHHQLGKQDGTVFVQQKGHYYFVTVATSSSSTFDLLLDTGSAYTWVGARQENQYVEGYASYRTPQIIDTDYAGGVLPIHLRANTYCDILVLGDLTANPQEIGIPIELSRFPAGLDGVLALGPSVLNTDLGRDGYIIPTVVENLYSQGAISSPVLGVYFVPQNVAITAGSAGQLSFGSIDTSVLTTGVKYVPVSKTFPANEFWGVDASIVYGKKPILGPSSGFLDTGTRRISVTSDAFTAYRFATGAVVDILDRNKRLTITQDQYNNLQTLSILIGDQSYDLSPNAQIYPRSSPDGRIFLVVKSINADIGLGFILGSTFFQRYYVVFNSSSSEIGFASHLYTQSTGN